MRGGSAEGLFIKRMRDIKFRGRTQAGKWVYGYYNQTYTYEQGYRDCIFNHNVGFVEVLPETVCQFTGLRDKNGKEIYEGDILLWVANTKIDPYENGQEVNRHFKRHLVVAWSPQCQGFGLCLPCEAHIDSPDVCAMAAADRMYIVGNIYDNPELL